MKQSNRQKYQPGIPAGLLGGIGNQMAFPEIFFKLQPEIDAVCDEWEKAGIKSPTPEMVQQMSKRIHENVSKKYPAMAMYARDYEKHAHPVATQEYQMFGMQVKTQGFFFDIIAFLLLSEFFFRRRRFRRVRRFY